MNGLLSGKTVVLNADSLSMQYLGYVAQGARQGLVISSQPFGENLKGGLIKQNTDGTIGFSVPIGGQALVAKDQAPVLNQIVLELSVPFYLQPGIDRMVAIQMISQNIGRLYGNTPEELIERGQHYAIHGQLTGALTHLPKNAFYFTIESGLGVLKLYIASQKPLKQASIEGEEIDAGLTTKLDMRGGTFEADAKLKVYAGEINAQPVVQTIHQKIEHGYQKTDVIVNQPQFISGGTREILMPPLQNFLSKKVDLLVQLKISFSILKNSIP